MVSILLMLLAPGVAPESEAAKRPPPPPPKRALPSDPVLPVAVEAQATGNDVRVPQPGDRIAIATGRKYCKGGPYNFGYAKGLGGKSFSATLHVNRFCHRGNQVSEISIADDHQLYGIYNFYMKFDHVSVTKGFYNYRNRGARSGYYVLARFYFLYCHEPTRNFCPSTYVIYLRNYVHADGTSTKFDSYIGMD
jgi:hypothetical protein